MIKYFFQKVDVNSNMQELITKSIHLSNLTRSHFENNLTEVVPSATQGQSPGICLQIHRDSLACRLMLLSHSRCTWLAKVTTKFPDRLLSKFIKKHLCVTIALTLTVDEPVNDNGIYNRCRDSLSEVRVAAPIGIERRGC